MLSCKDVTQLISESMDHSLPFGKRVGVRLHLLICRFCARYERQLLLIRETMRRLVATEEKPGEPHGETLSVEARERIRNALANP
ncbi:MAG: zf-HC2 domain-containing protein [Deltaproteobacteria bacterium]|nr:zf-HC2 domain-containing protein [Candidatus Deferrimicrobium borealis]